MEELFEQPLWYPEEPRFRRMKYFPLAEALAEQPTARLEAPGCGREEGEQEQEAPQPYKVRVASPRGLAEWERWLGRQATLRMKARGGAGRAGARPHPAAARGGERPAGRAPDLEGLETIQLAVLRSISSRQASAPPAMRADISQAAGNAAYVGVGNIAGSVLKYGSNVVIQRGFGAGAFGLYSIGMSLVSLITAVFNLGLDDAMVRYIPMYRIKGRVAALRGLVIFCTALAGVAGMLGALFMAATAPYLAAVKRSPELAPMLVLMSPMVPLLCMQAIWMSGLQGFKEFKWRVLLQRVLMPVALIALLVAAIVFFHNFTAIIVATVIYGLLSAVLSLYFFYRKMAGLRRAGRETYELRDWLGFAAPNFLTSVVDTVLQSIDTLLLAFFAISNAAIGQYAAAFKISGFIAMPLLSFNTMFAPMIAELHSQGEHQKLAAMFQIVTKWSITFSLPIFWVATLFAVPLLGISGGQFTAAWPLVIAFSAGSMINAGTGAVGYLLLMTGHTKISFLNSLAAVLVDVVLGVLLAPRYGAMGVAIATGVAVAVVNLMRLLQVRLLLKLQPYRRDVLKPLGAGLVGALATGALLYLLGLAHLSAQVGRLHVSLSLLLVPVFLAIYTGALLLLGIDPEDRVVLDMLRKKLRRGRRSKNKKTSRA